MRKLLIAAFIIIATFCTGLAQDPVAPQNNNEEMPNMGRAPKEPNGIGRLDLRVVDESGQPVNAAYAKLESKRTDGFYCESWAWTNERGGVALPPIHMGALKLIVKAKGYRTQTISVPTNTLDQPVRVTLARK